MKWSTSYKGPEYMCITENRDMQLLVKHIYFILYHPNKAERCFSARDSTSWMYGIGGKLGETKVAKWLEKKGRVHKIFSILMWVYKIEFER